MPKERTPFVQGVAAREAGKSIKRCPYVEGTDDYAQWMAGYRSTKKLVLSATEQLDELVTELSTRCKLNGWEEFVETCELPGDLIPALMTGRSELLAIVKPRAMTAEEVGKLYRLLGVLIETNLALQRHAREVAHQVDIWHDAFRHLETVGRRIQHFANFRRTLGSEFADEDELAA